MGRLASPVAAALVILAVSIATMAGAFIYEALGYLPCELCYKERIPYYAAFALAPLAGFAARAGKLRLSRWVFVLLTLLFTGNAALSIYHSGVERKIFPGPSDCSGPLNSVASVEDFMNQLRTVKVVRCDEPGLYVLGLTLANWNVSISAALAAVALFGATRPPSGDPRSPRPNARARIDE